MLPLLVLGGKFKVVGELYKTLFKVFMRLKFDTVGQLKNHMIQEKLKEEFQKMN